MALAGRSRSCSEKLGQQIIVDDRGGAGGNIGMAAVLSSPPDGYTIGFVAPNNAINATLYDKLPYDFIRDSALVAGGIMLLTNVIGGAPLGAGPDRGGSSSRYAKANPGKVYFACVRVLGASPHMSGELFMRQMTSASR